MLGGSAPRFILLLVGLAMFAGCSDDDPAADDEPCNKLVNDGPAVLPELVSAGTTPMGGTIVDGRYEQTSYEFYPNSGKTLDPNPQTYSGVFEFVAGKLEAVVFTSFGNLERTRRSTSSYVATDTQLAIRYSCPNPGFLEKPLFTATPSELRLFFPYSDDHGEGTAEVTLTKR